MTVNHEAIIINFNLENPSFAIRTAPLDMPRQIPAIIPFAPQVVHPRAFLTAPLSEPARL